MFCCIYCATIKQQRLSSEEAAAPHCLQRASNCQEPGLRLREKHVCFVLHFWPSDKRLFVSLQLLKHLFPLPPRSPGVSLFIPVSCSMFSSAKGFGSHCLHLPRPGTPAWGPVQRSLRTGPVATHAHTQSYVYTSCLFGGGREPGRSREDESKRRHLTPACQIHTWPLELYGPAQLPSRLLLSAWPSQREGHRTVPSGTRAERGPPAGSGPHEGQPH